MKDSATTSAGYAEGLAATLIPKTCGDCKYRRKSECEKRHIHVAFSGKKDIAAIEALEKCEQFIAID